MDLESAHDDRGEELHANTQQQEQDFRVALEPLPLRFDVAEALSSLLGSCELRYEVLEGMRELS